MRYSAADLRGAERLLESIAADLRAPRAAPRRRTVVKSPPRLAAVGSAPASQAFAQRCPECGAHARGCRCAVCRYPNLSPHVVAVGAGEGDTAPIEIDVPKAVRSNRSYARDLGWQSLKPAIVEYLGFSSPTPSDEDLARAIAEWQAMHAGLVIDGMLGPKSLRLMKGAVGPLPSIDVATAVAKNRAQGAALGWLGYRTLIAPLVGFLRGLPSERDFAQGLARWQKNVGGVKTDGILGPATLAAITPYLSSRRNDGGEAAVVGYRTKLPGGYFDEGHEVLTREAARIVGTPTADVDVLITGVKAPDIGTNLPQFPIAILESVIESQQKRHALRARLCDRTAPSLAAIRQQLRDLHARAARRLAGGPSQRELMLLAIGEGLHLIQDAYSEAHVERENKDLGSPILYVRFFARLKVSPSTIVLPPPAKLFTLFELGLHHAEHGFPSDNRDKLLMPAKLGGSPRTPAENAIDASAEYLRLFSGTTALSVAPFIDKHFKLSTSAFDPIKYHPVRCLPGVRSL